MTFTLTIGQLHRIVAALETMADTDAENGFTFEALRSRNLIETLIDQLKEQVHERR